MARDIMIVGNGEIEPAFAERIDAADLVIRFNDCRSVGAGGTKTDIVAVCNTGRPGRKMLHEPGWKENASVLAASSIWCVRDPAKFSAMRGPLALTHPDLDDFCDDYTDGFSAFARATGKAMHVIPSETHNRLELELADHKPSPYVVPSSGLVAIAEFLANFRKPGDRVALAGFGHQGWEWHPWAAERSWVERQVTQRTLRRLLAATSETPYITTKT